MFMPFQRQPFFFTWPPFVGSCGACSSIECGTYVDSWLYHVGLLQMPGLKRDASWKMALIRIF